MKKGLLSMLAILCMTSLFTACSKDDGPNTPAPTIASVEGVYKGELKIVEGGAAAAADDGTGIKQKVYITKISDSKIKMEIKNFAFGPLELGNIAVDECAVVIKDSKVTFTGTQTITLNLVGACDVDLIGVIDGEKIALDINVLQTSMNLNIDVKFAGTKMAADQSSEALITSFTLPADKVSSQPIISSNSIILMEGIPDGNLTNIIPTIAISNGATITPKSGVAQDFTKPIEYTVVSEDGITTKKYTVTRTGKNDEFTFDEWTTVESTPGSEESFTIPVGTWGSTNDGVVTINQYLSFSFGRTEYPVTPTTDAKQGANAVVIKTLHTEFIQNETNFNTLFGIPYITAGSLYPGQFLLTDIANPLAATLFGIPFSNRQPISFQGWYKYTPGTEYRDDKNMLIVDGKDKFAMYAVLYTELLKDGENVPLDGITIKNTDRIVFKAEVPYDGAKSEWTKFEVPFNPTGNYNPLNNHYMAFIATSSYEGDAFKGAKGSTLVIDDFKIISQ